MSLMNCIHFRVTYQNKMYDLTLLLFIMAVLGSIELKIFFLIFRTPRRAMIKSSSVKSKILFW